MHKLSLSQPSRIILNYLTLVATLFFLVRPVLAATLPPKAPTNTLPVMWTAGGLDAGSTGAGQATRIATDPAGNLAVVSGPALATGLAVTSYTANGDFRWRGIVTPSSGTFQGDWVAAAANGDVIAVGHNVNANGNPIALTMVRYTTDGTQLWRIDLIRTLPSVGRLLVDAAGNLYLAFNALGDGQDIELHKYNPAGALVWAQTIATTSLANDFATSLALSPDETEIFLTGDISGGAVWITASFDTTTGGQNWLVTAPEGVAALDVVVDATHVYVTGQGNVGIQTYLSVIAYDRTTGAKIWRTDTRPADSTGASGVRLSKAPDGSLVVAGQASRGFLDWYTVAFETTGAIRWSAVRDGGLNTDEIPHGVLVLADGTTIVTGRGGPALPGGFIQGVTAGYTPSGVLSWEAFATQETRWPTILPNGNICAAGGYDALITCWDLGVFAAGDLDPTFGVSSSGIRVTDIGGLARDNAFGVAQQADGKIIVVGSTDNDFAVVRYTSAGNMDATFSGDGIVTTSVGPLADVAYAVAVQTDGKIIVAGSSDNGTFDVFALARYTSNGTLDATFGTGGIVTTPIAGVRAIAAALVIQPDGKIIVTGESNNVFTVVRYTSAGVLDTTFDGDGIATTSFGTRDQATSLALQPDGKIVVLGMSDMGSEDDFSVARFNADGSLDFDFNGSGKTTVSFTAGDNDFGTEVALQPDGKIVLGGYTDAVGTRNNFALARLNANGTLDTSFGTNGKTVTDFNGLDDLAQGLVIQPTGHIILGGFADNASTFNDYALARYTSAGALDPTFGTNGKVTTDLGTTLGGVSDASDDQAYALLVQPDNKLVLAGYTDHPVSLGDFNFGVARYLSINNPPTVSNVAKNGNEDTDIPFTASDFTAHFNDPDGDLLNKIKITSLPPNGTLLLNGTPVGVDEEIVTANLGNLVFDPASDWSGSTNFGWNGSDGLVYATTGAQVNLTLAAVNDAPVNTVPAAFNVNEDTNHPGLSFGIIDLDAGNAANFQFTLSANQGTLTLATTTGLTVIAGGNGTALMTYQGTLTDINTALNSVAYQGAQNYAGPDTLTLTANDNGNTGSGGALTDTDTVSVTVNPVNDAPALSAIGSQSVDELAQLTFDANANDVENDTLTFSLDAGFPTGANIDSSTGLFTWTPAEAQGPGDYAITIRVTDNGTPALDDFETITVSVAEINLAPTLDPLPDQTVNELTPVSFNANAADADLPANTLTFSLDAGAPEGASVHPSTGVFTWTPAEVQGPGVYPITLRVTDDGSPTLSATQTFTITVNEVNAIPTVSDFTKTAPVNTPIPFSLEDFTAHFSDGEGTALVTLQITSLPGEGTLTFNGTPVVVGQEIFAAEISLLVFTPALDWSGSTSFTWTASDGNAYATLDATVSLVIDNQPYDVFLPLIIK